MTEARATLASIQEQHCPVCDAPAAFRGYGVVAPFITELGGRADRQPTTYFACPACDLTFFSYRYRDDEMDSLYGGYRGSEYASLRHRWEPWYTHRVNDAYSDDVGAVEERRSFMDAVLAASHIAPRVSCIVDFGGDEGQFFPSLPADRRLVLDVSNRPLRPGIERIKSVEAMRDVAPDLVVVAHVLEHMPDPLTVLREIRAAMSGASTLYVEVPMDRPTLRPFHASPRYGRWLGAMGQRRWTFIPVDFASGLSRQFGRRVPRLGSLKQSEHINYFSERSLERLLAIAGFTPTVHIAEPRATMGGLRIGRLGMVATLDAEAEDGS